MDDLVDVFDFPFESRMRFRMLENKRRSHHLMLRASAVVLLLLLTGVTVGMQQVPSLVNHVLAPLTHVTDVLRTL